MKDLLLECCVDSVESAMAAQTGGADRIELCSALVIGGLSPSVGLFEEIRKKCDIKIHVLLRPRFGDFYYSEHEFEILKYETKKFREMGAEGVVIGMLNTDGTLDLNRMQELIHLAQGMSVTLHRAFDMCREPLEALEQAKRLGFHTILTSGQSESAIAGNKLLKQLTERAGNLTIMPGGGITAGNIGKLNQLIGAKAYHMSGKTVLSSQMQYRKEGVSMGLPSMSEYDIWQTDANEIRRAREALDQE